MVVGVSFGCFDQDLSDQLTILIGQVAELASGCVFEFCNGALDMESNYAREAIFVGEQVAVEHASLRLCQFSADSQ